MVYALISIWSDKNVDYAMEFMLFYLVLVMFGRKIKMSWVVGGAIKAGNALPAVKEGYEAALNIK